MHNGSLLLLPDAGQVKAQQSYPKDHPSKNLGPMSIASPTTGADGRLNWEADGGDRDDVFYHIEPMTVDA
jgi:hypothetical protein